MLQQQAPIEYRVWDKLNKKFLLEFQDDYGHWLWGEGKHMPDKCSWRWILNHLDDYVVQQWTTWVDRDVKKIFVGDILECETITAGILTVYFGTVCRRMISEDGRESQREVDVTGFYCVDSNGVARFPTTKNENRVSAIEISRVVGNIFQPTV